MHGTVPQACSTISRLPLMSTPRSKKDGEARRQAAMTTIEVSCVVPIRSAPTYLLGELGWKEMCGDTQQELHP